PTSVIYPPDGDSPEVDMADFDLTPEQRDMIARKVAEKAKLEAQLARVNKWLDAVAVLAGDIPALKAPASSTAMTANGIGSDTFALAHHEAAHSAIVHRMAVSRAALPSMTDVIEQLANSCEAAIQRKELKAHLLALGFPAKRLGNYFYTVIHRL